MIPDLQGLKLSGWSAFGAWLFTIASVPLVAGALIGSVGTSHCAATGDLYEFGNDPEVVFLGNSMLYTRIDPVYLSQITGTTIGMLAHGGSDMPTWYLQAKNEVVPAADTVRQVVVFFRDDTLTRTAVATSIEGRCVEDALRSDDERVFDAIAHRNLTKFERFRDFVFGKYTIQRLRPEASETVLRAAASPMIPDLLIATFNRRLGNRNDENYQGIVDRYAELASRTGGMFLSEKLRSSPAPKPREAPSFSEVFPESFLPEMIDVVQDAGLSITFVRVQGRPDSNGVVSTSSSVTGYLDELRQYLASVGAGYYDFTGDPDITLPMYLAGDHIAPNAMERYMEIFADRLPELFGEPESIQIDSAP